MLRFIFPAIISLLFAVSLTMAVEPEVIQTDAQLQQAILNNPDTGEQRVYQINEEIDGWRIEEIKADSITMSHPPLNEGGLVLMKTILVKDRRYIRDAIQNPGE